MISYKLKGFSLFELIVSIGVSSIIIGSVYYLFSNINIINEVTKNKNEKATSIAYTYNLLKSDFSNSIPGSINNTPSLYLNNDKNQIVLHRFAFNQKNSETLEIIKVIWHYSEGKLYRSLVNFGRPDINDSSLILDYGKKITFKIEHGKILEFQTKETGYLPSAVTLVFGDKTEQIFTFRVSNS